MSSQHLCWENSNLLTPNTPDRKEEKKFPCKPAFEIEQPSCYCLLLAVSQPLGRQTARSPAWTWETDRSHAHYQTLFLFY